MSYAVKDGKGGVYTFNQDQHDLDDFAAVTDPKATDDDWRTVATWELADGEGVAFGVGTSRNPDRAEGYLYFDARSDDADGDGTPDKLNGRVRFVVLNAAGEMVDTISRHRLEQLRSGSAAASDRKNRQPYPYQAITKNGGEVIGGDGYQIGIQLKLKSGTDDFNIGNSTAVIEGYRGTKAN